MVNILMFLCYTNAYDVQKVRHTTICAEILCAGYSIAQKSVVCAALTVQIKQSNLTHL
jgi:hypothetical protein